MAAYCLGNTAPHSTPGHSKIGMPQFNAIQSPVAVPIRTVPAFALGCPWPIDGRA